MRKFNIQIIYLEMISLNSLKPHPSIKKQHLSLECSDNLIYLLWDRIWEWDKISMLLNLQITQFTNNFYLILHLFQMK